jgi:hypothetical protein
VPADRTWCRSGRRRRAGSAGTPPASGADRKAAYAHLTTEYAPRRYSGCTIWINGLTAARGISCSQQIISNEKIGEFHQDPIRSRLRLYPPSELRPRAALQPLMFRRQNHEWTPEHDARLRRSEGRSWAEIGAAFGVTRASAKARGRRIGHATPLPPTERLSSSLLRPLRALFCRTSISSPAASRRSAVKAAIRCLRAIR